MRAGLIREAISGLLLAVLLVSAARATPPGPDETPATATLHWEEGAPGCTFSRDDDGKYRYGLWTGDFGVVLAVDSQELEKVRRRAQPMFAVLLTMHYRGKDSADVASSKITLEFVKHYHDVHTALDPDNLATKEQNDADALVEETAREIVKHPEKKEQKEALLAARRRDAADMIEFLKTRTLRRTTLDPSHPDASGWVLFSTKSKWIEDLQKQEEFILRVPFGNRVIEFPFSLPPSEGDLILRRRPENQVRP
ncbi:MAG TPA: hypothetical protein VN950_21360 [Terriglobales bacterium]|nr:hypothetical protein [Terriglobales bacterium]